MSAERPNNMMAFEMPDNMTICHWRAPEKSDKCDKKNYKTFYKTKPNLLKLL